MYDVTNNMNDNSDIVLKLAQSGHLNDKVARFVFGNKKRLSQLRNSLDVLHVLIESGKFPSGRDYTTELIFHKVENFNNIKENLDLFKECLKIKNRDHIHPNGINNSLIEIIFSNTNIPLRIKENQYIFKKLLKFNKFNEDSVQAVFGNQERLDLIINNIDIFNQLLRLSHEHQFSCLVKNIFNNVWSFNRIKSHIGILERILELMFVTHQTMYQYESWIQDVFDSNDLLARVVQAPDVFYRLLAALPGSYLVREVLSDQKFYKNIVENKDFFYKLMTLNDGAGVLKRIFKDYSDNDEDYINTRLRLVKKNSDILDLILTVPNIDSYTKSNIIRIILDDREIFAKVQNNKQMFSLILKSQNCGQYVIEFIFNDERRFNDFKKEFEKIWTASELGLPYNIIEGINIPELIGKGKSRTLVNLALSTVSTQLVNVVLNNVLIKEQIVEV